MLAKALGIKAQARRVLARPKTLLPAVLVFLVLCLLGLIHHHEQLRQTISLINGGQSLDRDPGKGTVYLPFPEHR
jgi:hypothetical protein